MAAKIIANLIVLGSGIVIRAFTQAYQQALTNASRSGVAQEAAATASRRLSKIMTIQEARMILGVTEETPWEQVLEKYQRLFERNEKMGSFYVQSKVQRAKECLEAAKKQGDQLS
ncbi:hypothetical protein CLOM_g20155 [Closterium sp. NIES-68]|nr:hypothetical protein CLOM_g20155 [Closterium sp. NIES-68]GJP77172.1 hypothetical protein CLOP_g7601 [Closterium sp. NIES-67]